MNMLTTLLTTQNTNMSSAAADLYRYLNPQTIAAEIFDILNSNFAPGQIMNELARVDAQATQIANSFGVGQEQMLRIKKSLTDSVYEIEKMGGKMEDATKIQQDAATALGRNVMLGKEATEGLFAAERVTGVKTLQMVTAFKDVGISALDVTKQMEGIVKTSNEFGVSAQAVSGMVMKNMSLLNQYNFKDGVEGLSKMAAQAVSMRIDISDVKGTMERAFNPEGAIKMAAELQRLGVQQQALLDPMTLMNLAENDPTELMNQMSEMSKQFVRLNEQGQFEIMPGAKRQLREIEKSLGMSTGSLAKMALSSAEAEEKMKRIQFPDFASEEQKKAIASLAQMKDGKMMIEVDGVQTEMSEALGRIDSKEKIDELIKKTAPKSMEQLAVEQLDVQKRIAAALEAEKGRAGTLAAGTQQGQDALNAYLQSQTSFIGTVSRSMGSNEQILQATNTTLTRLTQSMQAMAQARTLEQYVPAATSYLSASTRVETSQGLADIVGTNNQLMINVGFSLNSLIDTLKTIFKVQDVIITKGGIIQTAEEDTIFAATGFDKVLDLINSPKNVPEELKKSVMSDMVTKPITTPTTNMDGIFNVLQNFLSNLSTQASLTTKETSKEVKVDGKITVNVEAPPGVDVKMLSDHLNKREVVEPLMKRMGEIATNNNTTPLIA